MTFSTGGTVSLVLALIFIFMFLVMAQLVKYSNLFNQVMTLYFYFLVVYIVMTLRHSYIILQAEEKQYSTLHCNGIYLQTSMFARALASRLPSIQVSNSSNALFKNLY